MIKRLRRLFRYKDFIYHEDTGRTTEWPRWKKLLSHRWYKIKHDRVYVKYPEVGPSFGEIEEEGET